MATAPGPQRRLPPDARNPAGGVPANRTATGNTPQVSLRTIVMLFCAALVATLWIIVLLQTSHEHELVLQSRRTETANIARVVEEHVVQTLRAADTALRSVRSEYARQGRKLDLRKFVSVRTDAAHPYNAFGVQDENGDLVLQSTPYRGRQNFRDSEDYQFHAQNDTSALFISKPRRGTTTGKASIYLSQRISRKDGGFGGLAIVAIDPDYFSKFYDQIDLGRDDVVNLIGRDGVVRARQSHDETASGGNVSASPLFTRYLPARRQRQLHGHQRQRRYRPALQLPRAQGLPAGRRGRHLRGRGVRSLPPEKECLFRFCHRGEPGDRFLRPWVARLLALQEHATQSPARERGALPLAAHGGSTGIWDWDLVRRRYYVSPEFKAMLGVRPERPFDRDDFVRACMPEDRERVLAAGRRHLREARRRTARTIACAATTAATAGSMGAARRSERRRRGDALRRVGRRHHRAQARRPGARRARRGDAERPGRDRRAQPGGRHHVLEPAPPSGSSATPRRGGRPPHRPGHPRRATSRFEVNNEMLGAATSSRRSRCSASPSRAGYSTPW